MLLAVAGCVTTPPVREWAPPATVPARAELEGVPFVPQAKFQCGPAALAMVLSWTGHPAPPDALVRQVYSSARHGSLLADMTGAARRRGLVAYPLSTLREVVAEVGDGTPVIVLQDLGHAGRSRWHYAVVIGYDLGRGELVLRSGLTPRAVSSFAAFERTWAPSGRWGLVVLPPRKLPATATEQRWLEAIVGLERTQQWPAAVAAYERTTERWPQSLAGLIGLGNSRYVLGDLSGAEHAYRLATRAHPEAAAAFNNLAHVLAELGRREDALVAARRAAELAGSAELAAGAH
jgi:Peptidase_C39 like family/Tetratricopeptide repeat